MKPDFDNDKAIYLQIAESIEDDILQGALDEESRVLSTNEFAVQYRINPATAAKGVNMLVNEGILYKKRGIGMFVSTGACNLIKVKRQSGFYDSYIVPLLNEASNLNISLEEVIELIQSKGKK